MASIPRSILGTSTAGLVSDAHSKQSNMLRQKIGSSRDQPAGTKEILNNFLKSNRESGLGGGAIGLGGGHSSGLRSRGLNGSFNSMMNDSNSQCTKQNDLTTSNHIGIGRGGSQLDEYATRKPLASINGNTSTGASGLLGTSVCRRSSLNTSIDNRPPTYPDKKPTAVQSRGAENSIVAMMDRKASICGIFKTQNENSLDRSRDNSTNRLNQPMNKTLNAQPSQRSLEERTLDFQEANLRALHDADFRAKFFSTTAGSIARSRQVSQSNGFEEAKKSTRDMKNANARSRDSRIAEIHNVLMNHSQCSISNNTRVVTEGDDRVKNTSSASFYLKSLRDGHEEDKSSYLPINPDNIFLNSKINSGHISTGANTKRQRSDGLNNTATLNSHINSNAVQGNHNVPRPAQTRNLPLKLKTLDEPKELIINGAPSTRRQLNSVASTSVLETSRANQTRPTTTRQHQRIDTSTQPEQTNAGLGNATNRERAGLDRYVSSSVAALVPPAREEITKQSYIRVSQNLVEDYQMAESSTFNPPLLRSGHSSSKKKRLESITLFKVPAEDQRDLVRNQEYDANNGGYYYPQEQVVRQQSYSSSIVDSNPQVTNFSPTSPEVQVTRVLRSSSLQLLADEKGKGYARHSSMLNGDYSCIEKETKENAKSSYLDTAQFIDTGRHASSSKLDVLCKLLGVSTREIQDRSKMIDRIASFAKGEQGGYDIAVLVMELIDENVLLTQQLAKAQPTQSTFESTKRHLGVFDNTIVHKPHIETSTSPKIIRRTSSLKQNTLNGILSNVTIGEVGELNRSIYEEDSAKKSSSPVSKKKSVTFIDLPENLKDDELENLNLVEREITQDALEYTSPLRSSIFTDQYEGSVPETESIFHTQNSLPPVVQLPQRSSIDHHNAASNKNNLLVTAWLDKRQQQQEAKDRNSQNLY